MDFKTLLGIATVQELERRQPKLRRREDRRETPEDVAEREPASPKKLDETC